jgi:HAE1 family hydrophobic/amphiphilic exporter-1
MGLSGDRTVCPWSSVLAATVLPREQEICPRRRAANLAPSGRELFADDTHAMISRFAIEKRFTLLWLALMGCLAGLIVYGDMPLELMPSSSTTPYVVVFPHLAGPPEKGLQRDQEVMDAVLASAGLSVPLLGEASPLGSRWIFSVAQKSKVSKDDLHELLAQALAFRQRPPWFHLHAAGPEEVPSLEIIVRPKMQDQSELLDWSHSLALELEGAESVGRAMVAGAPRALVVAESNPFVAAGGSPLGDALSSLVMDVGQPVGGVDALGRSLLAESWWSSQDPATSAWHLHPRVDWQNSEVLMDGRRSTVILVWRSPGFSDIDASQAVRKVLLGSEGGAFEAIITHDSSRYISESQENVLSNLLMGTLLTCVCVLLFVRYFWSTALVSLSIPMALVLTIPVLHVLGISRNVMSLAGAALGVGLVVDATLGTVASFNERLRLGFLPYLCAIHSIRENQIPLLVISLSTLAVFTPILFLDGMVGSLFWDLSLTVIVGQVVGFFVSVYLMPGLACLLHESRESHLFVRASTRSNQEPSPRSSTMTSTLGGFLGNTGAMVVFQIALFGGVLLCAWQAPPSEFLPVAQEQRFSAVVQLGQQTQDDTQKNLAQRVDRFLSEAGFTERFLQRSAESVLVTARHPGAMDVAAMSRDFARVFYPLRAGIHRINPLDPRSRLGHDIEAFFNKATPVGDLRRLDEALRQIPGVVTTQGSWNDELALAVVPHQASPLDAAWVPSSKVMTVQRLLNDSTPLGLLAHEPTQRIAERRPWYGHSAFFKGEDYGPVTLEFMSDQKDQLNLGGSVVVPRALAERGVATTVVPAVAHSVNGRMSYRYSIDVEGRPSGAIESELVVLAKKMGLELEWHPSTADNLEGFRNLLLCLAAALLIIALIILLQTRSLGLTIIVLATFLWGPLGSVPGLIAHGEALSASALVGFILLAGTIVNNGILLVNQVVRNRLAQMDPVTSCIEAVRARSMPVIITSLTTILGTLPLVFETGAGSQMYRGLAIVLVYGTLVSTPVSLIGVPSLVILFGRLREHGARIRLKAHIAILRFWQRLDAQSPRVDLVHD